MKFINKVTFHYRSNHKWGLKTDVLWLGIILAGLSFFTSVMPLLSNDLWWHLKIGEIIYQTQTIPTTNMFGWTIPSEKPFVYGAWLGEYLFYILYHWGGLNLITFSRNLLLSLTFCLMAYEAYRRTRSWRLAALATVSAYLMVMNNTTIRPQNWSWICFVSFLSLLHHYADHQIKKKGLLLLPLIMIFWVNAHGAFILGIILIGTFGIGESARRLFNLPEALSWSDIRWLGIVSGLVVLATIINPQGVGIFQYVVNLMTDQPSQSLIVEWQSPTPTGISNSVFFASLLLFMLLPWFTKYHIRPTEILLLAGFTWLAWNGVRYIVWYALALMPLGVHILATLLKPQWLRSTAPRNLLNILLLGLIFIPVIAAQPWFFDKIDWPFPERYWQLLHSDTTEGLFISADIPIEAAYYLTENPGRHSFSEMAYSSYFIWAIPEQGVFIDPRVELYPYSQWQDYIRISHGVRYNQLLDDYNVDRLVLHVDRQADLIQSLTNDSLWEKVYADTYTQIWDRCIIP